MSILDRLFTRTAAGRSTSRDALRPAYQAVVAAARQPAWYHDGAPDTLDGRFDMVTAILAQLLLRLETTGDFATESALLTEVFVDDMDGQLREIGIGDMIVGKHIGRMMAALGGRLGAYRDAGDDPAMLAAALERNMWRGEPAPDGAAVRVAQRLIEWRRALSQTAPAALVAGALPPVAT